MADHITAIDIAREHFEMGRRASEASLFEEAKRSYTSAADAARIWQDQSVATEGRVIAARLCADALYSAGMAGARLVPPVVEPLQQATLEGITIFETTALEGDVRLHGLYRAQCSAFELGHIMVEVDIERAIELFQDAIGCVGALASLEATTRAKEARLYANAAAASFALANLLRQEEHQNFKDHLKLSIEHASTALNTNELPLAMAFETRLLLSDACYEVALTESEQPKALERLEQALGWARDAAEAPGADAMMQADALLRGARYACVYGLYLRHTDFDGGVDALKGAIQLALATLEADHLPLSVRANAYDLAVRTQQNIALLLKESDSEGSRDAFALAASMATEFSRDQMLPKVTRAELVYLTANATLEQAIQLQMVAGMEQHKPAIALFEDVKRMARGVLRGADAKPDTGARVALLACGACGRLLRALSQEDKAGILRELTGIVQFGEQASELTEANKSLRAQGAFFAGDAANRLAEHETDSTLVAAAKARADRLLALSKALDPEKSRASH